MVNWRRGGESQSISYDGYLVSAKPAASSHGASLKSSCCISGTVDSGEADGDGDGHEDSAADSRQDEEASSEDGEEEQLLVGADDDVAAAAAAEAVAGFLAPFLDAAMFWQSVWSFASTEAWSGPREAALSGKLRRAASPRRR